jgi:hypothetical protein
MTFSAPTGPARRDHVGARHSRSLPADIDRSFDRLVAGLGGGLLPLGRRHVITKSSEYDDR